MSRCGWLTGQKASGSSPPSFWLGRVDSLLGVLHLRYQIVGLLGCWKVLSTQVLASRS